MLHFCFLSCALMSLFQKINLDLRISKMSEKLQSIWKKLIKSILTHIYPINVRFMDCFDCIAFIIKHEHSCILCLIFKYLTMKKRLNELGRYQINPNSLNLGVQSCWKVLKSDPQKML